jgi:hypothetical protein
MRSAQGARAGAAGRAGRRARDAPTWVGAARHVPADDPARPRRAPAGQPDLGCVLSPSSSSPKMRLSSKSAASSFADALACSAPGELRKLEGRLGTEAPRLRAADSIGANGAAPGGGRG